MPENADYKTQINDTLLFAHRMTNGVVFMPFPNASMMNHLAQTCSDFSFVIEGFKVDIKVSRADGSS